MVKRAYIHHSDGNAANNPLDGSNWGVLCGKCHKKVPVKTNKSGISIATIFASWKRAEIIKSKGYRCERCGVDLSLMRTSNKPRPKCMVCSIIIDRKSDEILWKDGRYMCKGCFEKYY